MTNSADAAGDQLTRARTETLNLVQWLSRIANSYVRDGAPEAVSELEFRAADAAFVTKQFGDGIALEIRLPGLEMQFLHHGKPAPHVFDPEEHSPAEVEAWLLVELLHRGIDQEKFSKKLPYKIPGLMSGDAEDHSPQSCQQGLKQLKAWFHDAAVILDTAGRAAGADQTRILCLPQTLNLKCVSASGAKPINFGFSPGDVQNSEPFFYTDAGATNAAAVNAIRLVVRGSILFAQSTPAAAAKMLTNLTGR